MTTHPSISTEIVQSLSIDNLINQRESVRGSLESARASLASADVVIRAITEQYPNSRLYGGVGQLACSQGHSHELRLIQRGRRRPRQQGRPVRKRLPAGQVFQELERPRRIQAPRPGGQDEPDHRQALPRRAARATVTPGYAFATPTD